MTVKIELKGPAFVKSISRVVHEPERSTVVMHPETGGRIVLEDVGLPLEAFLRRVDDDWSVLATDGTPMTVTLEVTG
jgi:hypothetical protein